MRVLRYEITADGFVMYTRVSLDAQGRPGFSLERRKYDGKDNPRYTSAAVAALLATGERPGLIAFGTKSDANTLQGTEKDNAGKVTATNTFVVLKEGTTLTQTTKDPSGKVTSVRVFDRQ